MGSTPLGIVSIGAYRVFAGHVDGLRMAGCETGCLARGGADLRGWRVRRARLAQHAYPRAHLVPFTPAQLLQVFEHVAVVRVERVGVARR